MDEAGFFWLLLGDFSVQIDRRVAAAIRDWFINSNRHGFLCSSIKSEEFDPVFGMHTNDRMLDPLAWNEAEFRAAIFAFSVVDADAKNTNFVQRNNSQLDVSLVGSSINLEGVAIDIARACVCFFR